MANSITKIQDTRKILPAGKYVAPNGSWITNEDPYFQGIVAWTPYSANPNINPGLVTKGEARVWGPGSIVYSPIGNFIGGLNVSKTPFIGFIFTVEMAAGQVGKVGLDDNGSYCLEFTESGRYVAILDVGVAATNITIGLKTAPNVSVPMVIKEFGMFDPAAYSYEDLLTDPVSKLVVTNNNNIQNLPIPPARLGVSDSIPADPAGTWGSNNTAVYPSASGYLLVTAGAQTYNYASPGTQFNYTAVSKKYKATFKLKAAGIGNVAVIVVGETAFNWYAIVSGCVVTSGPGKVLGTVPGIDSQYIIGNLSQTEETVVEYYFTMSAGSTGRAVFYPSSNPGLSSIANQSLFVSSIEVVDVTENVQLQKLTGVGAYATGDRLENIAWDGKFSTPVAWVCIAPGNPGTWKAVYAYDAINSTKDPFFTSYVGGVWATKDIAAGTGTVEFTSGGLVVDRNTSGYAGVLSVNGACECAVPYELITEEWDVPSGVALTRKGSVDNDRSRSGVGTQDMTLHANTGILKNYGVYGTNVTGNVIKKLLVRPKYPFLTKAPSRFTALPTQLGLGAPGALPDTWYVDPIYPVTYAANALTFTAIYSSLMQKIVFKPGRTYRARINFTVNTNGSVNRLVLTNDDFSQSYVVASLSDGVGIKDVTFTVPTNLTWAPVKIVLQPTQAAGAGNKIDYIRYYSE